MTVQTDQDPMAAASAIMRQMREKGLLPEGSLGSGVPSAATEEASASFVQREDLVKQERKSSCVDVLGEEEISLETLKLSDPGVGHHDEQSGPSAPHSNPEPSSGPTPATQLTTVAETTAPELSAAPPSTEAVKPESSGNNSESDKEKPQEYLWTDIDCADLETMPTVEVLAALEARNKGEEHEVPPFLLKGLRNVKGSVNSLIKIQLPAGVKKGQKVAFKFGGKRVKAVFNGDASSGGDRVVFAVVDKEKKDSLARRISSKFSKSWN